MSYKYNRSTINDSIVGGNGKSPGAYTAWNDAHINQVYEPQRLNNFEFIITSTDFKNLNYAGTTNDDNKVISSDASETLRLAVKTAFIPHYTQDVITLKRGNSSLKYAGSASYESGTVTIHDFIGGNAKAILMAWQNLSYNPKTEKVGLASDYKKTCTLVEYTPDYQVVRRWRLDGCWISGISEGTFDYESSNGTNTVDATIQFDRAIITEDNNTGSSMEQR